MEKTVVMEAVKKTKRMVRYTPVTENGDAPIGDLYLYQWALPKGEYPKIVVTIQVPAEGG